MNFWFSEKFTACSLGFDLQSLGYDSAGSDLPFTNTNPLEVFCEGQWVDWYSGSIWDTYAYQQHEHRLIPWTHIGIEGRCVRLQSKICKTHLEKNLETGCTVCSACTALLQLLQLKRFMERTSGDALPCTPWMYLNFYQTWNILVVLAKKVKHHKLQVWMIYLS